MIIPKRAKYTVLKFNKLSFLKIFSLEQEEI